MTKKLILPALLLMCTALFTTNGFAQTCSGFTGVNVKYMGVGSSAQFNTFAFAAEALLTNAGNGVNFWATSSLPLLDNRVNVTDTAKVWVAWDNASDCAVYAYFSVDSTIGVKSFFAYQKETNTFATNYDTAAEFVQAGSTYATCSAGTVVNAGQPACTGNLPSTLQTFFETQPGPTCSTSCTGSQRKTALPYCGQNGTTATTTKWCFFNAGHADIRPEDTLYATTRALSVYNSTNGLAGLGYANPSCGAINTKEGCAIYETFGQSGKFNVEDFALTGNDPITGAAVPGYVSMNIGAAPVVVFVNDADSNGFGAGAPNYAITNINHKVLSGFFDGTFACTGDVSSAGVGAGEPVQVVQRELLSGTYNTFEFNAVRILSGSAAAAVPESKASSITWFTDDDSGQELNNDPAALYNTTGCPPNGNSVPTATQCTDPLLMPTHVCGTGTTKGLKLRAIGTGEEVKATLDVAFSGQSTSAVATPDGLGYAFWGYGNFAPAAASCATNSGAVTCGSYLGHYLTVDGIDPLFTNPGDSTNPNGAYHLPQCYLKSGSPNCFQIPFTHVLDGSYPIWTILRAVTFSTVSGSSGQTTPASVIAMVAEAERAAGGGNTNVSNLDDFVPFFQNINTGDTTGDLNLFVFRSHYKQTNNPNNGHAACAGTFTSLPLTPVAGACLVDAGGDVGGSVFTVQSDVDFNADFGSVVVGTSATKEVYGLHQ